MPDPALAIELATGRGDPVRIEWDPAALARVATEDAGERPFQVAGGFDPEHWKQARILSAALSDGRLLAIAALRPSGAGGHGDDAVVGIIVRDGEVAVLDEVLLSLEYGPDREPRRLGLELYEQPDSLPVRIAGDSTGRAGPDGTRFELRAEGTGGGALLSVLRPA